MPLEHRTARGCVLLLGVWHIEKLLIYSESRLDGSGLLSRRTTSYCGRKVQDTRTVRRSNDEDDHVVTTRDSESMVTAGEHREGLHDRVPSAVDTKPNHTTGQ